MWRLQGFCHRKEHVWNPEMEGVLTAGTEVTLKKGNLKGDPGIIEHPKLEWTHRDHRVQHLALHSITQNQTLHLGALSRHSVNSCSSGPCPLPWAACSMSNPSLTPSCPSPDTSPCHSFGPIAVTESRAQRCPSAPLTKSYSHHEGSPHLLCSGLNQPKGITVTG